MEYQLVFHFECQTLEDFDRLRHLEDAMYSLLQESADANLDGNDVGLGEFNLFVHCHQPRVQFPLLADFIDKHSPGLPFSAGYRRFEDETYTPIWPPSLTTFEVA
jgi:hypothetical protein